MKSSVFIPVNGKTEHHLSQATDDLSQSPMYPAVFSPDNGSVFSFNLSNIPMSRDITYHASKKLPTAQINGEITNGTAQPMHNTQIQFKKWQSNLSSFLPDSTQTNHSSIRDLNKTAGYATGKRNIFEYPDIRPTSTIRRSKSAHHTRKQYKK